MRTVSFGLIGCGWMGREFASAVARWGHLVDFDARPELIAICNRSPERFGWFQANYPSIRQATTDYRVLLANPEVEVVYVAVPHHWHREIYCAVIEAGKDLMGEKPFGIDEAANQAILDCLRRHPRVFVRCASQWLFYPPAQRIAELLERGAFGRLLEAHTGFLHSSDLDPRKPINWKRQIECNGEYGCLGDLGMHVVALPFRAGWQPRNVRALLSDVIQERPDKEGRLVPCCTWDNAMLLCETLDPATGATFPWTVRTHRIAPGERNTWYVEIYGTKASARFSTRDPKRLELLEYTGGEQVWGQVQVGYETPFATITAGIAEFGFGDAVLQMWAAFLYELVQGRPLRRFAASVTPEEVARSHRLFTAALASQRDSRVVRLEP